MQRTSRTTPRPVALFFALIVVAWPWHARTETVIQRRFSPDLNGPWMVISLGTSEQNDTAKDPKRFAVGPDNKVYVYAKRPLEGPPAGSVVLVIGGGTVAPLGPELNVDGDGIIADAEGVYVGTKGTPAFKRGEVYRFDGSAWVPLTGDGLSVEVLSLAKLGGIIYAGTSNDGVWRVDASAAVRVGVRTVVQPEGYLWEQLGDYLAELDRMDVTGTADIYTIGKDLKIRGFGAGAWTDLGNLAEATYDGTGAIVSFVREPKSVAVLAGVVYVGTKGGTGAPEGKDIGAVWKWNGSSWDRLGTTNALKKEAKAILPFAASDILLGTNETGVFFWNGTDWTPRNKGLPPDAGGKTRAETLTRGNDGNLYIGVANKLYKSIDHALNWTEIGFLALGEEIKSIGTDSAGVVYVGTKLGDGSGAVFRLDGTTFTQVGGDLIKEVRHLVVTSAMDIIASLGGGGGAYRWNGTAWISIIGNLTGGSADIKQVAVIADTFYAATKVGIHKGKFSPNVTTIESPLSQKESKTLLVRDGQLLVGLKRGGIWRLVDGANGDDGKGFARVDQGLPDVDVESFDLAGNELFAVGKPLLYRAELGSAPGTISFTPFGMNPGAAQLDGDGKLIFSGSTELKAVVRYNDRVFAGTKDGLFVSSNSGATWTLFNGPAEVKALVVVGHHLYAAVKGDLIPDPTNAPTVHVKTAELWIRDLDIASDGLKEQQPAGCGCVVGRGGQGSAGSVVFPGLLLALVVSVRRRRRVAR